MRIRVVVHTFRKIEGESRLISAEVVDVENQLLRQLLLATPDHPADARVYEPVLVATCVDALHPLQSEVPLDFGVDEWRHEATACRIHVNWNIPPARYHQSPAIKNI